MGSREVNVGKLKIDTIYGLHAMLYRWSGATALTYKLSEDPRQVVDELKSGANLFSLLPDLPKEQLLEPEYDRGIGPDFYDITLLEFKAVDYVTIEEQRFNGSDRSIGPCFCAAGQVGLARNFFQIPKRIELVTLKPGQLISAEITRLRQAMSRRG